MSEELVYLREPVNLLALETEGDETDPPGYRPRMARVGPLVGGSALGASVYDLDPGESVCPYHYHYGDEEWLLVLEGRPTIRDEDGDDVELARFDAVCFPEGPEGAHKVTNRTDEPVRVAIVSTTREPSVCVYPDSGKIGVWPPGKLFRLADERDYWDGELQEPA